MRHLERSNRMSNVVWINSDDDWRRVATSAWTSDPGRRARLMADRTFEMELDRMFGEAPVFAANDLFAGRGEGRLDRGWPLRRLVIGGLGIVGGLIGGAQVLGSGLIARMGEISTRSN